jgi:hypothetical protein
MKQIGIAYKHAPSKPKARIKILTIFRIAST